MVDTIADMLTRIRNAQMVKKSEVSIPYSTMKHRLADILVEEGYVEAAAVNEEDTHKTLVVTLKYRANEPVIRVIKRMSTPGRRMYVGARNLPYVFDDLGIAIISTSRGLMTNKKAREQKMGGEVICEIF